LIGEEGVVGKDGGIYALSSDDGDWTWPMSGCGVPPYTAAAAESGSCWALLRLKKKNNIRAAAETATRPPATPPPIAPALEEPPGLDEVDEGAVTVVWEDGTTEGIDVDVDVDVPGLIVWPPSTSGRSESGAF
jgi:hypothetical protein